MACQAGKDVYVEKPTSVAIAEGRRMVEAARRHERIVQVGTQQRSQPHFARVVELIRGGRLGKVTMVRTWHVGNQAPEGIGNPPDSAPPPGLDWDMWLGPAPKVPFNPNRFGVHPNAWSYFRYFWDYAGGLMTDWGVHLIDIVHWAMDVDAPTAVAAIGGKLALVDNRDTPDTLWATYQYPGFVMSFETRSANARPINEHGYGIEFHGTDGTLFVDRGGFAIVPEKRRISREESVDRTEALSEQAVPPAVSHPRNFIDCVKSRALPICDVEIGHRSSTAAILGNLAYRSGASLRWDGKQERIDGNDAAEKLLGRRYRRPWKL
jgi:predicted dehydrogenase